jgi:hypothetical protein
MAARAPLGLADQSSVAMACNGPKLLEITVSGTFMNV